MKLATAEKPRTRTSPTGFSLVEMLVVIGIIAVLMSLLLPALSAARRSAQKTKCLINMREIGLVLSTYLNNNHSAMPWAVSTNSWDSPYSPRGLHLREVTPWVPGRPIPDPPRDYDDDDRLGGGRHCISLVAVMFQSYLKRSADEIWQCPLSNKVSEVTGAEWRNENFVLAAPIRPCGPTDQEMEAAYTGLEYEFRPSYQYMSTHEFHWYRGGNWKLFEALNLGGWMTRNIAGMRTDTLKTVRDSPSHEIATFVEYNSIAHSKGDYSIWTPDFDKQDKAAKRGVWQINVLYLDGHVATANVQSLDDLLRNHIHPPIRQKRWGVQYTDRGPDFDADGAGDGDRSMEGR